MAYMSYIDPSREVSSHCMTVQVGTSGYKWFYVVKSGLMWFYVVKLFYVVKWFYVEKVVESGEKWGKVGQGGEKLLKVVMKSGEKWIKVEKVVKSGEK